MADVTSADDAGDFERRARQAANVWLERRTLDGLESISTADLEDFTLDGRSVRLMDRQRGIWKPRTFQAAFHPDHLSRPRSSTALRGQARG